MIDQNASVDIEKSEAKTFEKGDDHLVSQLSQLY